MGNPNSIRARRRRYGKLRVNYRRALNRERCKPWNIKDLFAPSNFDLIGAVKSMVQTMEQTMGIPARLLSSNPAEILAEQQRAAYHLMLIQHGLPRDQACIIIGRGR